jgi:hypothetical protein
VHRPIDGRPAGVHADLALVHGYEGLHTTREGVVETYLHVASPAR